MRGVGQAIAVWCKSHGGKSGLHRAECQVTPGGREPTESATESVPPKKGDRPLLNVHKRGLSPFLGWVRVKRCGKSAPRGW